MSVGKIVCAIPNLPEINKFDTCVKGKSSYLECENESHDTEEALSTLGYTQLGKGVHRIVFGLENCAIKVARDADSALANKIEWDLWNSAVQKKHPLKDILLPIVSTSPNYAVIVSPKVERGTQEDVNVVAKKLLEAGYSCFDIKPGNVGKLGSRLVLIDYGFGLTCHIAGQSPYHV